MTKLSSLFMIHKSKTKIFLTPCIFYKGNALYSSQSIYKIANQMHFSSNEIAIIEITKDVLTAEWDATKTLHSLSKE